MLGSVGDASAARSTEYRSVSYVQQCKDSDRYPTLQSDPVIPYAINYQKQKHLAGCTRPRGHMSLASRYIHHSEQ